MTYRFTLRETPDIETASDSYAQRFAGDVGEWFLRVQEEITLQMLKPYPGARVLDVGGGHGQTARTLVENGYDLTVLGSAEECNRQIHSLVNAGRCQFRVGDILDLPFEGRSFDVVISYRLLPHVSNWGRCLSELARVARHAVIVDYPDIHSFNYLTPLLFSLKKQAEGNTRPYTCFRMYDILQVLNEHNFIHEDHHRQFFWPMVLHRQLNNLKVSRALERVSRTIGLTENFGSPVILKSIQKEH